MRLFKRRKPAKPSGPPENAHGQRNIDGTYFSVARRNDYDPNDPNPFKRMNKYEIVDPVNPPEGVTIVGRDEAHAFIVELEGLSGAYSGIGFKLL